jgi:1-aminocyclopropane-1-carboxylate deaminase/D-cysteine desulfhydrase-like pyridoxal-dependent ACC family enzyme
VAFFLPKNPPFAVSRILSRKCDVDAHRIMNLLASEYPDLNSALPFTPLTDLPTPLYAAEKFGKLLNRQNVWIKRDDLSARLYGGNKVRKLDYLIADALKKGCDSVVTFGAAGSNHALATAIYARKHGLKCYAVMTDQPGTPYVATTLRWHVQLGTELVHADGYYESVRAAEHIEASHPGGAACVYRIPWGGSSWLGVAAFVNAGLELSTQIRRTDAPGKIYAACGTMGTIVGLAMGMRIAGYPTRIVAVQVVPDPVTSSANIEKLFETTNRALHDRDQRFPILDNPLGNIELRSEFLGDGYALPTAECAEAVKLMQRGEGLKLETTYTGKALAALIHDARTGEIGNEPAVFWNTYNSRPCPPGLDAVSRDDLPAPFRHYLDD